ncbi:asparaginase [Alicyclobacillus vulcanalis]|uniref:Asparaginase n=1 Tax=Alicyclobacillus vulcanalis TaxID=252246 RepID=A0A1N7LJW4_9BACL|nr:asparaginase [Alicyclobacillus vulcanalis]SIS74092.1 asparaginase [Alicyclobacillus vulcanalis]
MKPFVRVTRGAVDESWHAGAIAVANEAGEVVAHVGDLDFFTFARSSCKPIQAIPVVESGALEAFGLDDSHLAIMCASHSSEPMHVEKASEILERIGLEPRHLVCGVHMPHSREAYEALVRRGETLSAIHNNCSGKHAGMLAYCRATGADPATYAELDHPLQQAILSTLSELAGVDKAAIRVGVDGCGVPVHALPLRNWARAFSTFVAEDGPHAPAMRRIRTAMGEHPELVGGSRDRFDTDLMRATRGRMVAKGGAEGFLAVIDTKERLAMVVKILDGNARAIPPVALKALEQLGSLTAAELDALAPYVEPAVVNTQGREVGRIIADFSLTRA